MSKLNEHIKQKLLEDESLKYALATNMAKYGRPQSKKSDKPTTLTKGLEKKREKHVKDLKKQGLEEHDYGRYDEYEEVIEKDLEKRFPELDEYSPQVHMGYYDQDRPDSDPYKGKGYGDITFRTRMDVEEKAFKKALDYVEKDLGFEIVSSERFHDEEPGERDYFPQIKFHFKIADLGIYGSGLKEGTCGYDQDTRGNKLRGPGGLGEVTKPYGEKYPKEKFAKLKGKQVKYYGSLYTVVDADPFVINLENEDGKRVKVNINQFNEKGMVDEKKKKRDRCLKIADRKFKKPSAYKSGAVVRCRKGNIWKGVKESIDTLDEKKKETLRTWFGRKGAAGKVGGWVDCNTGRKDSKTGKMKYKPCGRKKGEKRAKYPSCRPTPAGCKDKGKGKSWGKTK